MAYRTLWQWSLECAHIEVLCDRIIVMDEGKIAGIGKHAELLDFCGVYREIYESQNTYDGEGSL